MKTTTTLWVGIGVLLLLSPLGLILPGHFKAGDAWGEWGPDSLKELVGYIPQGVQRLSGLWRAPLSDYALGGGGEKGLGSVSFAYIVSALLGILTIVCMTLLLGRLLRKKEES